MFLQPCLPKYGTIDSSMLAAFSGTYYIKHCLFNFLINGLTLLNFPLEFRVELSARCRFFIILSNLFLDMSGDTEIFCTSPVFLKNMGCLHRSTYVLISKLVTKVCTCQCHNCGFLFWTHVCSRISFVYKEFSE